MINKCKSCKYNKIFETCTFCHYERDTHKPLEKAYSSILNSMPNVTYYNAPCVEPPLIMSDKMEKKNLKALKKYLKKRKYPIVKCSYDRIFGHTAVRLSFSIACFDIGEELKDDLEITNPQDIYCVSDNLILIRNGVFDKFMNNKGLWIFEDFDLADTILKLESSCKFEQKLLDVIREELANNFILMERGFYDKKRKVLFIRVKKDFYSSFTSVCNTLNIDMKAAQHIYEDNGFWVIIHIDEL